MSSTRYAEPGAPLSQERWASTPDPEIEPGLKANLVAIRCRSLKDPRDRDLIWSLQKFSREPGGLGQVIAELIQENAGRIGTESMVRLGTGPGRVYSAAEVREVRREMYPRMGRQNSWDSALGGRRQSLHEFFPLQDDSESDIQYDTNLLSARISLDQDPSSEDLKWLRQQIKTFPKVYPASVFTERCEAEAKGSLDGHLSELCLNPEIDLADDDPWYFSGLVSALRAYASKRAEATKVGKVITSIGRAVHEAMDDALAMGGLHLVSGNPGMGNRFAAECHCDSHPGRERNVLVPSGNDDFSFFVAIASKIGVSNNSNSKANLLRHRIEKAILDGKLALVFSMADNLWPQCNPRFGFPSRIAWVVEMVKKGLTVVCLISPSFFDTGNLFKSRAPSLYAEFFGQARMVELSKDFTAVPQDLRKRAGTFCVLLPHGRDE